MIWTGRRGRSQPTWGQQRRSDQRRSISCRCGKDSWSVFLTRRASEERRRSPAPHPTSSWSDSWRGGCYVYIDHQWIRELVIGLTTAHFFVLFFFKATSQTVTASTSAPGLRLRSRSCLSSCFWPGYGFHFSTVASTHGNVFVTGWEIFTQLLLYWFFYGFLCASPLNVSISDVTFLFPAGCASRGTTAERRPRPEPRPWSRRITGN